MSYQNNVDVIERMQAEIEQREVSGKLAYKKRFLPYMINTLGDFCEHGVNHLGYDLLIWFGLFLRSGVSTYFCMGAPALEGRSGMDMARQVDDIYRGNEHCFFPGNKPRMAGMPRYCTPDEGECFVFGRNMAWLQWYRNEDFASILSSVTISDAFGLSRKYSGREDNMRYLFVHEFEICASEICIDSEM